MPRPATVPDLAGHRRIICGLIRPPRCGPWAVGSIGLLEIRHLSFRRMIAAASPETGRVTTPLNVGAEGGV